MSTLCTSWHSHAKGCSQCGQAAIEALVSLLVLGVLWVGVSWLGRIQDMALHASHASRHAAFMAARQEHGTPVSTVLAGAFHAQIHQWRDRKGQALQSSVYPDIDIRFQRSEDTLPAGKDTPHGPQLMQLRNDWLNVDERVLTAHVSLVPLISTEQDEATGSLLKLHQFDASYPLIRRQTSILTGAGHASDDLSVADRIANSALAWSGPADQAYRLGRRVASVGARVDAGWNRPEPVFDWLRPWAEELPSHHLHANH